MSAIQRQRLLKRAEAHRREKGTVSTVPVFATEDYASCGQAITLAMHHLDEALPSGQRCRARASYFALQEAVAALGLYMLEAGYFEGEGC